MKNVLWMVLVAAVFSVTACSKSNTRDGADSATSTAAPSAPSTTGQDSGGGITVSPLEAEQRRLMQQLVVYFDYDQAEIKPEFNSMLAAHGQYLAKNASASLRLEGNTDERGSREYNVGLGQRRSDGVKKMLILLGAKENQIESVSLGEEKPQAEGHSEDAWSKNRRSDILYGGEF